MLGKKFETIHTTQPSTSAKATGVEVHFANFVPSGLPKFWTHYSVGVRHFAKDYSVPLAMTAVFLLMFVGVVMIRSSQHAKVAGLLPGVTSRNDDYGTLTSRDKTDNPQRNTDNDQTRPQAPARAGNQALNVNPGTPTAVSPAPNTSPPPPASGGSLPAPFSAAIAFFQQGTTSLECTSTKPKKPTCSKRYIFSASISTQNGPGTVNYGWRSNVTGVAEDSSFVAASGSAVRPLQKEISLACLSPGTYNLQLVLLSPVQSQSTALSFNHDCNDI